MKVCANGFDTNGNADSVIHSLLTTFLRLFQGLTRCDRRFGHHSLALLTCVAVVANAVTHLLLINKHSAGLQLHIVGLCRDMLDDCANTGMCTLLCTFCSFVHHQMFAATTIQEIDGSIVCNGYPEIGGSDSCCVGTCADGCLQGGVRASRICGDVMEVS